jgi:chromosome segregation ATPase
MMKNWSSIQQELKALQTKTDIKAPEAS